MIFSRMLEMLIYDPIVDDYDLSAIKELVTSVRFITSKCEEDAKTRLGLQHIRQCNARFLVHLLLCILYNLTDIFAFYDVVVGCHADNNRIFGNN